MSSTKVYYLAYLAYLASTLMYQGFKSPIVLLQSCFNFASSCFNSDKSTISGDVSPARKDKQ